MSSKGLLALLLGGAAALTGILLKPPATKTPGGGTTKPPVTKPKPPSPPIKLPPPAMPAPTPPPAAMPESAKVVSIAIPDHIKVGERARWVVTMRNTGTVTWDGGFRLGVVDDLAGDAARFLEAAGVEPNRVQLPAGQTVAPGTDWAFAFDVVGPKVQKTYLTRFRMVHEGVQWFGAIAEQSVVVDPPPPVVARRGLVRADNHCVRDDDGPFSALGATLFWGAWGYKNDRAKLERALDALSKNGFDYIRCLGVVGDINRADYWDGREISAKDPDHKATIAGLTDLAYDKYGLRVEWTLIGDGQVTVPTMAEKFALADEFLAMSRGREHKIMHFEIANESWQNGFGGDIGKADLRTLARYVKDRTDILVATSSPPNGDAAETSAIYAGGVADMATVHFDRDCRKTEGAWRPVRQPWEFRYMKDMPALGSSNEPIGPGSSVAEDRDPLRLCASAATCYVAGVGLYVFHTVAGIRGLPADGEIADMPGLTAFKAQRALLPADLPNWTAKNGHWADSPFRFYAKDASGRAYVDTMWPDLGTSATGAVRGYSSVRGNDFVTYPIGIRGSVTIEARRAMTIEIFEPLTGTSVAKKDLAAREPYELKGGEAFLIKGTYR